MKDSKRKHNRHEKNNLDHSSIFFIMLLCKTIQHQAKEKYGKIKRLPTTFSGFFFIIIFRMLLNMEAIKKC